MKSSESGFGNFEKQPGLYEVIEINNTITDLAILNVVTDHVTLEKRSSSNNFLDFRWKVFFKLLDGLSPNWELLWDKVCSSGNIIIEFPTDKDHLKRNCLLVLQKMALDKHFLQF